MDIFFENLPETIRAGSQSTLGILALIVCVIAIIALFFFRRENSIVKFGVFVILILSFGLFYYAAINQKNKIPDECVTLQSEKKELIQKKNKLSFQLDSLKKINRNPSSELKASFELTEARIATIEYKINSKCTN